MIFREFLYLHKLKGNLRLKPLELEELQRKKLTAIVRQAYENVPFYHKKLRQAGIKPDDIKTLSDMQKIPITTRNELQSSSLKDLVASNVNPNTLIKETTSGSTGIPLTTFFSQKVKDFENAVRYRAFFENGLKLRDRVAAISDPRHSRKKKRLIQHFGILNGKTISIYDPPEKQMTSLLEFKPTVIKGYPSALIVIAERLRENCYEDKIKPRLIFTGAELLDKHTRRKITSAFEAELFDYYSSIECGLIAWECKEHNGYHVNADAVLTEFLDDNGETVTFNERGKIVCTNLYNSVMPLIRYELGDVAILSGDKCACGVSLPLIKLVEGRADDFLMATDGRLISPTVFFPYPFDDIGWIKQFRVIQESLKRLIIQVAAKEVSTDYNHIIKDAENKILRLFGRDMEVKFEFVGEIPKDPSGKLRKVISHVKKPSNKNG